jgi:scyllo-inositol 2-dehydrogenase (NADP+)
VTVRVGLIGAGKMGLSHLAIVRAHPDVELAAICDDAGYVLSALEKHTKIPTYKDHREMIDRGRLDAVIIATPTSTHFQLARHALEKNLHLFVEKPLTLSAAESRALSELAIQRRRVNQVGFHSRFIGTFQEARRVIRSGAIGTVVSVHGSAFGSFVVREVGSTWRSKNSEGGGCLHGYASHVIDLMNFMVGPPSKVVGARLQSIFSRENEDAVYALFNYPNGASGVLEANWSDDSHRKMSTAIVVQGTTGKVIADRQEIKVHLRAGGSFDRYSEGWTVRYITELQKPVAYYLRGEEYTSQIDTFIAAVTGNDTSHENAFASAYETDRVIDLILQASQARS